MDTWWVRWLREGLTTPMHREKTKGKIIKD